MCVPWCRFVITLDADPGKRERTISTDRTPPERPAPASDGTTGVYGITVAAELAGMSVQALRLYERKRLLEPARTAGGTRRYSDADITRLRRISALITDGINLTGIARVLGLEADNATLHTHNRGLRARNAGLTTTNAALRASNTELETDNAALRHHAGQHPSPHD
jgi:MerR family transcriptional regulator, heat shock protein HspR